MADKFDSLEIRCHGSHIIASAGQDDPVIINGVPHSVRLEFMLTESGLYIANKMGENHAILSINRADEKRWNVDPTWAARDKAWRVITEKVNAWATAHRNEITMAQGHYREQKLKQIEASRVQVKEEMERLDSLYTELLSETSTYAIMQRSVDTYVKLGR